MSNLFIRFIHAIVFVVLCFLIGLFIDTYIRFISNRRFWWDPAHYAIE